MPFIHNFKWLLRKKGQAAIEESVKKILAPRLLRRSELKPSPIKGPNTNVGPVDPTTTAGSHHHHDHHLHRPSYLSDHPPQETSGIKYDHNLFNMGLSGTEIKKALGALHKAAEQTDEQHQQKPHHPTSATANFKQYLNTFSNKIKDTNSDLMGELSLRWSSTLSSILPLGGSSEGNLVEVYSDGDEAFSAMWDAIAKSRKRIWMETYIFKADNVGKRTLEELTKAARRGCDVTLIVDAFGSVNLSDNDLKELRETGKASIVRFNPMFRWPFLGHSLLFRDHRKILVCDDEVAFCGGMNIGDEYAGLKCGGNGKFRDTHVKVSGPCVHHLASVFLDSLETANASLKQRYYPMSWQRKWNKKWAERWATKWDEFRWRNAFQRALQNIEKEDQEARASKSAAKDKHDKNSIATAVDPPEAEKAAVEAVAASEGNTTATEPAESTNNNNNNTATQTKNGQSNKGKLRRRNNWYGLRSSESVPLNLTLRKQMEKELAAKWARMEKRLKREWMQQLDYLTRSPRQWKRWTRKWRRLMIWAKRWQRAQKNRLLSRLRVDDINLEPEGVFVQVLQSNVHRNKRYIQQAMRITVLQSTKNCYLTTPYFMPPKRLFAALKMAARRGVDVKIITAGQSDVKIMKLASQHIYSQLLDAGVKIYEYYGRTLHAKTSTIDGIYCTIGSFNLDLLSEGNLLEVNLTMLEPHTAQTMEDQFHEDLKHCKEVTKESLANRPLLARFVHALVYHVIRILHAIFGLKSKLNHQ